MSTPLRVLIVEDQPDDAELIAHELRRGGFDLTWQRVETAEHYITALDSAPDAIIADFSLPTFGALEALRILRANDSDTPFIVVTGTLQDDAVVACLQEGASDYLLKDRLARLGSAVTQALARSREQDERRRLEEQLRHAQRLESVGRLAGGVAHDFNNLLTVIGVSADMILDGLEADHPVRRDAEEIRRAADRAALLTQQLLAFSRKQVLQPRVLQLNDVVASMGTLLRRLIGADIDLVTRLAPGLGHVKVDPSQVEQVIVNLAVNARDAMPKGGILTIATDSTILEEANARALLLNRPGPYVRLALTDTGIGMDEKVQARLFEPFFTTKAPGKGTGLGLATVHGIIRQSGGSITVDSEPGRGTAFEILLPLHEGTADAPQPAAQAAPGRGAETVLVAEDEDAVRDLIKRILSRHGYTVLDAPSGARALKLADGLTRPVDLLVSDVVMPGMSGHELHEQLLARQPGLKALYISGYTENVMGPSGVLDPGTAFLHKPFTPDGLLRKVRAVLDGPGAS